MSGLGMLSKAIRNQGPPIPVGAARSIFGRAGASPPSTGIALEVTEASSTMFGIVNRLSVATAAIDWELMRNMGTGNEDDDEPVESHLALDVWNNPNPFMTGQEYREILQQHIDLTGEGWTVFGKTGKWPTSMWPVRPDRMAPVPSATDYLSGYVYSNQGEKVPLRIDECMFIRMPNPNDAYRGLGPVQSLLLTIDAMRYGAQWNRNTFLNNGEPGGVIEVMDGIGDDDFDEFAKRWDEMHRGVAKAGRIAILEGGMKWVPNGYSPKDMQFVQLQTVGRDVIYEAYGMPKSAMGVTENVNRANASAGKELFQEQLVVPRLDRIKRAANKDFLPQFGPTAKGLYFRPKDPVPPNSDEQRQELSTKAQAALWLNQANEYDAADILVAVGLPEIKLKAKPDPVVPPVVPVPAVVPPVEPEKEPAKV